MSEKMTDNDIIDMANRCIEEITALRAQVAALAPKADAYDTLRSVVRLATPPDPRCMSEDIVWRLKRQIDSLKESKAVDPSPKKDETL